eukprot:SAG31_NODE_3760_length_3909_cov_2.157743_6_plen_98_part_00
MLGPAGINGDGCTHAGSEGFYTQWDSALAGFVPAADKLLAELRSPAKLILNEFVNSVSCHYAKLLASGFAFFRERQRRMLWAGARLVREPGHARLPT